MGALLIAVLVFQFRARKYVPGHLLAGGRPDQRRRHAGQRQPGRQPRRHPADDDDRLQRHPDRGLRQPGTRASARSRSTPSSRPAARPSTGWRSSSPSPSAPRPATSSPSSSNSATWPRSGSSPGRSSSSPSLHFGLRLNAILSFWLAYILTRPLGASIGDYLASADRRRRPRPRHEPDQRHLPQRDPRAGRLPGDLQARRDRGSGADAQLDGDRGRGRERRRSSSSLNKIEATPAAARGGARAGRGGRGAASSSSCRTPTTSASIASPPTPATARRCWRGPCRSSRSRPASRSTGRVAASPNAYDDIVEALKGGSYREIILETPAHPRLALAPRRPAASGSRDLGYPLTTVTATALAEQRRKALGDAALAAAGARRVGERRALDGDRDLVADLRAAGGRRRGRRSRGARGRRGRSGPSRRARRRRWRAPARAGVARRSAAAGVLAEDLLGAQHQRSPGPRRRRRRRGSAGARAEVSA